MSSSASCLCRKVTFEVSGEPQASALCYCTHCQRSSGSAFSHNLVFPASAVKVTSDTKPTVYIGLSFLNLSLFSSRISF